MACKLVCTGPTLFWHVTLDTFIMLTSSVQSESALFLTARSVQQAWRGQCMLSGKIHMEKLDLKNKALFAQFGGSLFIFLLSVQCTVKLEARPGMDEIPGKNK